jgi:hypothetical protein
MAQLVVAAYSMNTEQLALHFSNRHAWALADDQDELNADMDEGTELAYRAYHERLHRVNPRLTHKHESEPPEAGIERALRGLRDSGTREWCEIAGLADLVHIRDSGRIWVDADGEIYRFDTIEEAADFLAHPEEE